MSIIELLAYTVLAAATIIFLKGMHDALQDLPEYTGSLEDFLRRQIAWSSKTFGTGRRTLGNIKHIQKELAEIKENPFDLVEWVDVIILAMDGYWRHGGQPDMLLGDLYAKLKINENRVYPAPTSEDEPVEHDRSKDGA